MQEIQRQDFSKELIEEINSILTELYEKGNYNEYPNFGNHFAKFKTQLEKCNKLDDLLSEIEVFFDFLDNSLEFIQNEIPE